MLKSIPLKYIFNIYKIYIKSIEFKKVEDYNKFKEDILPIF